MAKNVLDMILWHPKMDFNKCSITYVHRGALGNLKKIGCTKISSLERGFLILDDETQIPCHRIVKIEYEDQIIWKK